MIIYHQVHYCIGCLIRSSVKISAADSLFARSSSDYVLDLFLFSFVTKHSAY